MIVKRIGAVLAGVLTAWLIVFIGDTVTHLFFPPPENIDFHDQEALKIFAESIPWQSFVIMMLFWLLAAFAGGFVSAKINKPSWKRASIVTGSILLAGTILNLILIPHPLWLIATSLILIVPSAYMGGKTATLK
ncbi:MAG: hypothetical protein H0W61_13485 [Bacteroidetes bacterium]|nr:hypothetical protein [Bacteroidota bacterium]